MDDEPVYEVVLYYPPTEENRVAYGKKGKCFKIAVLHPTENGDGFTGLVDFLPVGFDYGPPRIFINPIKSRHEVNQPAADDIQF